MQKSDNPINCRLRLDRLQL